MRVISRVREFQTMRVLLMLYSVQFVNCVTLSPIYNHGSATAAIQDHVCVDDDVTKITPAVSDMYCAVVCSEEEDCWGFFYHHADQTCVLCRGWYLNTDSLTGYQGMLYYHHVTGPDVWNDWSPSSTCSVTCGGGTHDRTRTCALPSCYGPTSESGSCHDFDCRPLATTCADWVSRGLMESCDADIDPDGAGGQFGLVRVPCDLGSEPGKSITVIHHDRESRTRVSGYERCGAYTRVLAYTIGFAATKMVVDESSGCSQYVLWECFKATLSRPRFANTCTAWKNRNMIKSTYFTGDHTSNKYCECGQTDTCVKPRSQCNCDYEDNNWHQDGGNLTNKADLPIYAFTAGDTGGSDEEGYHTIGPMLCY